MRSFDLSVTTTTDVLSGNCLFPIRTNSGDDFDRSISVTLATLIQANDRGTDLHSSYYYEGTPLHIVTSQVDSSTSFIFILHSFL